jgi:transposase
VGREEGGAGAVVHGNARSCPVYDPWIREEFYERLLGAGKPKKVGLVACMRKKLLSILNSMLKYRTPWREKHALAA